MSARSWIGLVGVCAVLLSGCSVPRQVDHGEAPGVVPLEAAEAPAMMKDYDARNNAAIKRSHRGDGRLWRSVDTGPFLAADLVAARVNAVDPPKESAPADYRHEVQDAYSSAQPGYPLWTAVRYTTNDSTAKGAGLLLLTKDGVDGSWRGHSGVWLDGDLPTSLPAREATPSAADLERAAQVDQLLATWVEEGEAPGLEVTKDLADFRSKLTAPRRGVSRVANTSDPWGGAQDVTAPGGSVRAVRVEEGLLVFTAQEWEHRSYLAANFEWDLDDTEARVFPHKSQHTLMGRDLALSAAILVPDTGDARVLGAHAPRVLGFPR